MHDDPPNPPRRGDAQRERGRRARGGRRTATRREPDLPEGPETWRGYRLSPFQRRSIAAISDGHNVLVSAPTGAGKTLVAEYAIEDAVRRGRRCVYTAPIKALSNQKFRDFREAGIDVGLLTGDVTIRPHAQVLIMTTEILRNSIFDNPEYLQDVEFAIFDEVHFLDDPERGCVWEECLIFAPREVRIVCLSATIPNLDEIGDWLSEIRHQDMVVVRTDDRPVPLHHALFTPEAGVFPLSARRRAQRAGSSSKGRRGRKTPRGHRGRFDDERPPPLGALLDDLTDRAALPALVFAFSRRDCERLAVSNARRNLLDEREREEMAALQRELIEAFELEESVFDGELLTLARSGISYHHAGMLPVHKDLVERLFTTGRIKLLFTTETFAVGINMPAHSVVFHSLRKFDGVSFDYLRTRDFLQMAGRAGRQGIDHEGLIFCSLSQKDLREAPLDRIMTGTPEPIRSRFRLSYSTLLHLVPRLGRERLVEAWENSLNQFQHAGRSQKVRERNSKLQRHILDAHLALLDHLGYLEGDRLTPRGRFASRINGYELQMTEHVFRGSLEELTPEQLAIVFVAHVHEERRRGDGRPPRGRAHSSLRRTIVATVRELRALAGGFGVPKPPKEPDFGLTPVVVAWTRGAPMEDLESELDATPGDLVRTLRMSLQLMRQVRRAIDPDWDLSDRLGDAMASLDRDEVDARHQLDLG